MNSCRMIWNCNIKMMLFDIVDFYFVDNACLLDENDKTLWVHFCSSKRGVITFITVIAVPYVKISSFFFIMLTQLTQFWFLIQTDLLHSESTLAICFGKYSTVILLLILLLQCHCCRCIYMPAVAVLLRCKRLRSLV